MGKHPGLGESADEVADFKADPDDLEHFDSGFVLGYFNRLELIMAECTVDIYAASSLKHPWPFRLQKAGACATASFWRGQNRILDSNIMDPTLTNEDILREAVDKEATAVVAKDYLPFKYYDTRKYNLSQHISSSNYWEATIESIEEFIELHDPDIHPTAYIPIQPPYHEHIADIRPLIRESHLSERYMLGGLKDAKPDDRLEQATALRDVIGDEPHLHGLGWGPSDSLVQGLRANPGLIDSIDNSGPSQAIMHDQLLNKNWQQTSFGLVEGDYRNSIAGAFEFGMLLQAAHRFSKYNTDFDRDKHQRKLTDF